MGLRFRIGDWLVEPDLNHMVRADRAVQLEPKVMDVLAFLASHPGEVCSKETIIKAVWPGTFVSDDVLAYSISELRKAFGDSAREPSVIATIAKRGYRLIAPVTTLPEERHQEMQQAGSDPEKLQSTGTGSQPGRSAGRWISRLRAKAAAALLSMTLLLTLLVWYLLPVKHSEMTRLGITPVVSATARSIAVIPFDNLSPDPQNAFFSDGFTEDLINQLSKIRHLRVISRAAVARYRNDPAVPEIEQELGVEMILKGSVRRETGQVRISAKLIDARSGAHLWGETYDRELTGIFRIQSDVARTIASTLNIMLSTTEQGLLLKEPTADLAAYDYYLKGREYYRRYRSRDNENAIALFEKALQLDPDLALAHAGLADCYAQKAYQFGFPAVWTERAFEESRKALSIDPELAEAHKALGFAYWNRGQFHQALNAYYRAVELNPSYSAPITNIAATLEQQGKYFEALQWAKRALSLNPTEPIAYFNIGDTYRDLHDIDRAEEWYRKALSLNPDYEPARIAISRLHMVRKNYPEALKESQRILSLNPTSVDALSATGHAYLASGDLEKAGERYRSALAIVPDLDAAIHLSLILWKQGRRAEAQGLFDQLTAPAQRDIDRGSESWRPWWVIAVVRAVQGDTKEALSYLEKAAAAGWRPGPGGWDDHHYETLLGEGRYRTLMTALNNDVTQQRRRALLLATPPEINR